MGSQVTDLNEHPFYELPAPATEKLSDDERDKLLDRVLIKKAQGGGVVQMRGDNQVVLEYKAKTNHVMHLILSILTLAVMAALLASATAQASVAVGQNGDSGFTCGGSGFTLVQDVVASNPAYTVPGGGGVLTSWSHLANGDATTTLRLKVYRPTADPTMYTTTAETSASPILTPNTRNRFTTRIPVQAGDILGLSVLSGDASACVFQTIAALDHVRQGDGDPGVNTTENFPDLVSGNNLRINVSAVLEPDADHDGYGDETQDQCPSNAATQGPCPVTTKKKKCKKHKKHKKHKSGAVIAKKCKKKKHH